LDFGSQYTQLIARRIRELKVYCEIHPFQESLENIKTFHPHGIILSGSPASSFKSEAPKLAPGFFDKRAQEALGKIPVLGI
jgi:GMP synthase (glutamine-hydrolysing)